MATKKAEIATVPSGYLSGAAVVAFDFETAPLEPYRTESKAALDAHKAHIVGISFSVAEGNAVYVPMEHYADNNAWRPGIWAFLRNFATNPSIMKVAHNLAFESAFLYARGIVVQPPCYDTISSAQLSLKSHTEFRSLSDCGLKRLVPQLFGVEMPSFETVIRESESCVNECERKFTQQFTALADFSTSSTPPRPKPSAMPVPIRIIFCGFTTSATPGLMNGCQDTG
jgi:DNA polymerase I-like protein with 3'-5' exonuclease and polymerase domains